MAKETAHQLGTPLSSMLAWIEILKSKNADSKTVTEMSKDIERLEQITERFSKIGSPPKLEEENIVKAVEDAVNYLRSRTSKKVCYNIKTHISNQIPVSGNQSSVSDNQFADLKIPLNANLFSWVIENICKNAVDAMDGDGVIDVDISAEEKWIYIDISDTGKGLHKSKYKAIFQPGYTSKQRGWGLGLSLAKKIIENYHDGKIFVKNSVINKGTTFRIALKRM